MRYTFADCELDEQGYQLRRSGEVILVEPQVFKLLAYLLAHRDRVVSREELFDKLWPGQIVGDAALTYCVAKARKAVQDTGAHQRIIKTIHGHGYRFIAPLATTPPVPSSDTQDSGLGTQYSLVVGREPVDLEQPIQPSFRSTPQSRQLALVSCLFVFGWLTSLWQVSVQAPGSLLSSTTVRPQSTSDLTRTEGKLYHWWVLSTTNQVALDSLLKGWEAADRSTPAAKAEARWLFQRAIELDPTYAAAYASLGWLYWRDWLSWSPNPSSLEQASLYIQKAVALDSSCARALTLLADVRLIQKRQAQAIAQVERVISADLISAR